MINLYAMKTLWCTALFLAVVTLPGTARSDDLIGEIGAHRVSEDETLLDIARAHGLGFVEMRAANPGIDPWLPGEGREILLAGRHVLPSGQRRGIVVNLGDMRLYYFPDDGRPPRTFAIGIGRLANAIPLGNTKVEKKRRNPRWLPTAETRARNPALPIFVPPGPWNPLGRYTLDLGWDDYSIHGTNRPWGIGRRVSRGCVRLYPEGIELLYNLAAIGMPVTIVDQPVKTGWADGVLYLEVHPAGAAADTIEATGLIGNEPPADVTSAVIAAAGDHAAVLDWHVIRRAAAEQRGVPVPINR